MANKHLNKCSTSIVIREMLIKTTLRFHLIEVRMAKIKNSGNTDAGYDVEKKKHSSIVGRIQPLWKSVYQILRKLDILSLEYPSKPTPGHIPK